MRKFCIRHIVCHTVYDGIFTLAHLLPISTTTIFWTALWSSVSGGSDGRRWAYQNQGEQVSPSIIHPATARDPGIERLAIDSFPTTAVSNWYVYLKLLTIDRCASSENKYHTNGGFRCHTCFFHGVRLRARNGGWFNIFRLSLEIPR